MVVLLLFNRFVYVGGNRRSHVNIQCCAGGFGSNGNKIATKEDTVDANINEGENEVSMCIIAVYLFGQMVICQICCSNNSLR